MRIYIDFHGVLTDRAIYLDNNGKTYLEKVNILDKEAIRKLIEKGHEPIILTQSDSPTIQKFADLCGCKVEVMDEKKGIEPYYAIGDNYPDLELLRGAKMAFVPSDYNFSFHELPNAVVLVSKGGQGCINEMLQYL